MLMNAKMVGVGFERSRTRNRKCEKVGGNYPIFRPYNNLQYNQYLEILGERHICENDLPWRLCMLHWRPSCVLAACTDSEMH